MRRGRWRLRKDDAKDVVKVVGKFVAAGIDVDRWVEGLDENRLFDTPFCPVVLRG